MRGFDLLADSSCDLPLDIVKEFNIEIIPMSFTLGTETYAEDYWQSITPESFYSRVKSGERSVTSQINVAGFDEIFSRYAEKGRDVLFVCLSGQLSGTCGNALSAAQDVMARFPGRRIRVIDGISATLGSGLLTLTAALQGDQGLNADETADYIEQAKHKHFALFTVDDLMFLHAGGRLSKFSAIAGSILGVKPVLWIDVEGNLKLRDKRRGRNASLDWLVDCMAQCITPGRRLSFVNISHGNCPDDAEYLQNQIAQRFEVDRFIVNTLGAVIGSHSGPGTVALFYQGDITRAQLNQP